MAKISGGVALEKALAALAKNVTNCAAVEVGFLENATYPDGTPVAMVAAVQEYGSSTMNIPSRPFFRNMIREKSHEWGPAVAALLNNNDMDARRALEQAGAAIKGQLQEAITNFEGVPLSPKTIAAKGFDKQLIDTAHMLNSVAYQVKGSQS